MTSIDNLEQDLEEVSDDVLGNLSTGERIRTFAKEVAGGNEERTKQLADTAPVKEYTAADLEYLDGIKKLGAVSLQARHELQKRYQAVTEHEATRNQYMAVLLLNESLSRLPQDGFEIDEFGCFDVPAHEYASESKSSPSTAYLATKYRDLWEDIPADLLVDEDDQEAKQFPNLAALGLMACRGGLSGEAFEDLDDDRISSEVYLSEIRLVTALVDLHTRFHGWRLFAEEQLDVSLDEVLNISAPEGEGEIDPMLGVADIDEQLCENILSLHRDYFEAYPAVLEEWSDDDEEIDVNLDARARSFADGLDDVVDLPV